MSLTENDITAKNFKKFFTALSPYLGSYDKGKLTFVGEVKAFFAETAPNGFLVCDGATYNKADYPELVSKLFSLTDTTPYVVSGDNTKFKVPDLRGEFLRGSGTNSHTNQGNGAGVGVHQDGTLIPFSAGNATKYLTQAVVPEDAINTINPDKVISDQSRLYYQVSGQDATGAKYTSRPTNTSVLFCIAYKDTMVDLDFLSYGGERFAKSDMYDTNERVIGKWIDGKPLYQKTVDCGAGPNSEIKTVDHNVSNMDKTVYISAIGIKTSPSVLFLHIPYINAGSSNNNIGIYSDTTAVKIDGRNADSSAYSIYATIQYTKTTDTADSFKYSTPTDYSTEEKIVGTWIDGKPLWQKSFDITNNIKTLTAFGSYTNILNISSLNIEEVISCVGSIKFSRWRNIPYNCASDSSNYDISYAVSLDGSYLNAYFAQTYSKTDVSTIQKAYATIQYTKTTDA